MNKSVIAGVVMAISLAGCSSGDDDGNSTGSGYQDTQAAIDLSRGGYRCYQMITSMGNIDIAVDERQAPITAANFKQYVDSEFYNGTLFHRVIDGFMIQGGGIDTDLERKETQDPIKNESKDGLKNYRSRIAMARTGHPDSATSQFFINTVNNHNLDYSDSRWGYAVFGGVIAGMDVVDAIAKVPTSTQSGYADMPNSQITIDSVALMNCPAQ